MLCPCCSGLVYDKCCQPLIDGQAIAQSPEALMRSRYCAYQQKAVEYIYNTYAATTQAQQTSQGISQWAHSVSFVKLEIVNASPPQIPTDNAQGHVEFIAFYLQDKTLHLLHEKSRFICERQQWRYIDGVITPEQPIEIGRNDPCPCLSGKKFKKCHG